MPIITAAAAVIAVAAAIAQYAIPAVVPALERSRTGVVAGEWWRLVTPLLVQTLGWYQVVLNLVTLALVGVVVERAVGHGRWVVLFAAGALGGQFAAYATREPGGGDSIAICGLAGGMIVWLLASRPADRWAAWIVVGYVAALAGWGFGGVRAAAVASLVAMVALVVVPDKRFTLAVTAVCAIAMASAYDLHGVSLVSGMIAGILIAPWRQRGAQAIPVTGLSTPDTIAPQLVDAPAANDPL
ncbi:rhomboid family intramembrane serine protease [Umezawaea sp. Da 62-37]|uniref:rhomboid family intramembrane serine protease n=1 Tax=Umezawaea sp. Da 62-37 TaxID=3075927 RepID=UPI0028F6F2AF|nr:rhomboid family intramembrane serine protease [Umezawaea sp. Da 62-37]WNV88943.1 rhomboid family intramembrane serine protease [Umezawaea sp. Da 62-37]